MSGITGETLLQLLERRLDNVVYRLGFAIVAPQARQLVRHGHFMVNGKKVDIPSYLVKPGDVVDGARDQSRRSPRAARDGRGRRAAACPSGSQLDKDAFQGKVSRLPTREQINLPVQEQLIVELYSK